MSKANSRAPPIWEAPTEQPRRGVNRRVLHQIESWFSQLMVGCFIKMCLQSRLQTYRNKPKTGVPQAKTNHSCFFCWMPSSLCLGQGPAACIAKLSCPAVNIGYQDSIQELSTCFWQFNFSSIQLQLQLFNWIISPTMKFPQVSDLPVLVKRPAARLSKGPCVIVKASICGPF